MNVYLILSDPALCSELNPIVFFRPDVCPVPSCHLCIAINLPRPGDDS